MDAKIISPTVSNAQAGAQQRPQYERPVELASNEVTQVGEENTTTVKVKVEVDRPAEALQAQTTEEIEELVDRLNTQALSSSHTLRFSIDEELGKAIISVVDSETDEVIRQIPPETALQIAEAFEEVSSGQLLTELA